jgi:putative drug exporter of the RND superfamily
MAIRRADAERSRPGSEASTDRLASALRRLRWPVAAVWVLAIAVLLPAANGLAKATDDTASAYLPSSAQSARVASLQQGAATASRSSTGQQAIVVFARPGRLTAADLAAAQAARAAVRRLAGPVRGLGLPTALERSADGGAALFTVSVSAPQDGVTTIDTQAVTAIRDAIAAPVTRPDDGLQAAVTGAAAVTADSGSTTLGALLLSTLVIVAVILLLVYQSPVLWLLPLISAIAAVELARAAAHGLAVTGLTVSYLSSAILIVLAFGAASDYALLLVHRYREQLRQHAACEQAMAAALRTTLPTLLASCASVTGAMLCLLAARSASLHGLGPIGATAIVSAFLAGTTFLPALLLIAGRAAFWPRVPTPGEPGGEASRLWSGIGARIARHPARVTLAAVMLLGLACAGLTSLRTSDNPLDDLKGHPGSVVGEQLLAEHFPAGAIAPLTVLVPRREARAAAGTARTLPGVASVSPGAGAGRYAGYTVVLSVPPFSARGSDVVAALRRQLASRAPAALVGGTAAAEYDIAQAAGRDTVVIIPLVLLAVLLVIAAVLRAIVAPVVLVATTALSVAAALGLSSLLWRYVLGYPGADAQLPLYIFIFLVALGVDYNIFLSARVREESGRSGTRPGTLRGLAVTGGVITAAGVILAATFAALAQLPSVSATEVGTAIAIGVLLDTLLVRTVVVPAAILILDDATWWPASGSNRSGPATGSRRDRD